MNQGKPLSELQNVEQQHLKKINFH